MSDKTIYCDDLYEVPCPHCGRKSEMWENSNLTTYWAEEGEIETICHHCDKTFLILEHVHRHWEIAKTTNDYD